MKTKFFDSSFLIVITICISAAFTNAANETCTSYGYECTFPFTYNGVAYNDCLRSVSGKWCGIRSEVTVEKLKIDYDYCIEKCPESRDVTCTTSGYKCLFPFAQEGFNHTRCLTYSPLIGRSYKWCPIVENYRSEGEDVDWGKCADSCPENGPRIKAATTTSTTTTPKTTTSTTITPKTTTASTTSSAVPTTTSISTTSGEAKTKVTTVITTITKPKIPRVNKSTTRKAENSYIVSTSSSVPPTTTATSTSIQRISGTISTTPARAIKDIVALQDSTTSTNPTTTIIANKTKNKNVKSKHVEKITSAPSKTQKVAEKSATLNKMGNDAYTVSTRTTTFPSRSVARNDVEKKESQTGKRIQATPEASTVGTNAKSSTTNIAIIVVVVAFVAIVIAALVIYRQRRRKKEEKDISPRKTPDKGVNKDVAIPMTNVNSTITEKEKGSTAEHQTLLSNTSEELLPAIQVTAGGDSGFGSRADVICN